MPDVFLSHATIDDDDVNSIANYLEANGLSVWVDHRRGIEPGTSSWDKEIRDAIKSCKFSVFIMSEQSLASEICGSECLLVRELNKPLYTIKLTDVKPENVWLYIKQIQYADVSKDFNQGMNDLVQAMVGKTASIPNAPKPFINVIGSTIDERLTSIPMTGRDMELEEVHEHINNAVTQLIAIGGTGKSRLAVETIMTLKGINGALWHVCSEVPKSAANDVIVTLREYYGMDKNHSETEVFAKLKQMPRLIVIDNAESITNKTRRKNYVDLIRNCRASGVPVLITSRVLWDEFTPRREISLKPLQDASKIVLDMAENFYKVLDKAKPFAERIAIACQHHPKLIEWAVSNLTFKDGDRVLKQLSNLSGRRVQEQLDEMIQVTYDEMCKTAKFGDLAHDAIQYLIVCPNFNYKTAKALTNFDDDDDLEDALDTLLKWNFLRLNEDNTRYLVDPVVQANLDAHPDAHQKHYDYFKALANKHNKTQDYVGLHIERENLEAAFDWALTQDANTAYWMANAMAGYLRNRGLLEEGLLQMQAVEQLFVQDTDIDRTLQAKLNNSLGIAYANLAKINEREENLKRSIESYKKALIHRTPKSMPLDYAITQGNLGNAYRNLSDIRSREINLQYAINAYEQALIYLTPKSMPLDYAMIQNNLAIVYSRLSEIRDYEENLKRSLRTYDQALIYYTPDKAPLNYANTQRNKGIVHESLKQFSDARQCWQEAEKYYRLMGMADNADLMLKWIRNLDNYGCLPRLFR